MDSSTLMALVVQVIAGIIGGQAVGAGVKQAAMGQLPKILSGALGGLAGGTILGSLLGGGAVDPAAVAAATNGAFDLKNLLGGAGGVAILTAIVGIVMNSMKR